MHSLHDSTRLLLLSNILRTLLIQSSLALLTVDWLCVQMLRSFITDAVLLFHVVRRCVVAVECRLLPELWLSDVFIVQQTLDVTAACNCCVRIAEWIVINDKIILILLSSMQHSVLNRLWLYFWCNLIVVIVCDVVWLSQAEWSKPCHMVTDWLISCNSTACKSACLLRISCS